MVGGGGGGSEIIPDEFSIFAQRAHILSVAESDVIEYQPINSVENAQTIEFNCLGFNEKYKDLSNCYLRLRVKLTRGDGSPWMAEQDVTSGQSTSKKKTLDIQPHLVSNGLFSIFKSAHVSLNGIGVHSVEGNYHYRDWIETTLNFNRESAMNRLSGTQLYAIDNDVAVLRGASLNSKSFELFGKVGVMNISKLLIPNVSFNLRLSLENPDFYLIEPADSGTKSVLKILDARLYLRHVTPTPDLILAHEKILASGNRNATYEYKRGMVITQNVPAGVTNLNIPNFYSGNRPAMAVFCMVENGIFVGNRAKTPYEFSTHGLSKMNFLINGQVKPSHPLEITTTTDENYTSQIFSHLYQSLNYHNTDKSVIITQESFVKDHFLIPLDLTASGSALSDANEVLQNVTIGITGTFNKALSTTITCILYLLLPSRFEITGSRAILNIY